MPTTANSTLSEPLLAPSMEQHASPPERRPRSPQRQLSSVLHIPKEALRGVPLSSLLMGHASLFAERVKLRATIQEARLQNRKP